MKKIVAIGGSNSKNSINKQLAEYAANQVANSDTQVADLSQINLPLYSIDLEKEDGIPSQAQELSELIGSADGLVVSLAEHNGSYTAAFKNAYDWLSRIDKKAWKEKPMFLMATSPGGRGGATVLQAAKSGFPYLGGNIIADFSLPSFHANFSEEGIQNEELRKEFDHKINLFEQSL